MPEPDDDLPTQPPAGGEEGALPGAWVPGSDAPATPAPAPQARDTRARKALPETLTAARDAKAYVAQLFADVHASDAIPADAGPDAKPEGAPEATGPAEPESPVDGQGTADALPEVQAASGPGDAAASTGGDEAGEPSLRGVPVLILGLGLSGLAMARWCVREGAEVTVADTREAPPQLPVLRAELPGVQFRGGAFSAALVEGTAVRAVFKSPGLSPAQVAPAWDAAGASGLWRGGELDLFAHALRVLAQTQQYRPQVLAVTGTNGKTTTTALTARLVAHAGRHVAVAGNIGPTLLDTLAEAIDAGTWPEVWVLELSSFQLDGAQGFEPTAAVVLNLTQDHLDWHGDMAAYGAAKARVFGAQGLIVLNRDDPQVMAMLPEPVRVRLQKPRYRDYLTFGTDLPQRPGDFGLETVNGMTWLVRAQEADETQKRKRGEEEELFIQRLMPADALRIRGRHNATNALAALALAQAAGCPLNATLYALREYTGEPHRVEPVATVREVEYFDDSKGTNVGATVAALNGLGPDRRIVAILGGDGKGQDFSPLFGPVQRYARACVLIGRDAPALRAAVQGTGVPLRDAATLPEAVQLASELAQAGDAVLLSPACASLDMFENYEHRARVFIGAVQALSEEGGWA